MEKEINRNTNLVRASYSIPHPKGMGIPNIVDYVGEFIDLDLDKLNIKKVRLLGPKKLEAWKIWQKDLRDHVYSKVSSSMDITYGSVIDVNYTYVTRHN